MTDRSRRRFLKQAGATATLASLGIAWPGRVRAGATPGPDATERLPLPAGTVAAACERILPRDQDPGAIDLGVVDYVQRLYDRAPAGDRVWFWSCTVELRQESLRRHGKPFLNAAPADQDALLAEWLETPGKKRQYVLRLIKLTLEGAFGDPVHGGNRDARGFKLLGFPPDPFAPTRRSA